MTTGSTMHGLLLRCPQESLALEIAEVERPIAAEGEAVVEVRAAAVNRSDLLNVRGLPVTTFPRVLGRDFSGVVVDGPENLIGHDVWGSGAGDLGFSRDGCHAQYAALPVAGLVEKPARLTHDEAAACGLAYYTASVATLVLGQVRPGDRVLVLGAAGGIGSAAAAISQWKGADVIGAVKDESEAEHARARGIRAIVDTSQEDLADAVTAIAGDGGVDVIVDTVGPALFAPALSTLGMDGRMILMTAPLTAPVMIDLGTLYRKRQRLIGLSTIKGDVVRAAALLRQLLPGFESGALEPPAIAQRFPLSQAADAYALVAAGRPGRVLLVNEARDASP
jgi:NADPH:quinone reductase-like Zn-dependent oxidoreductase